MLMYKRLVSFALAVAMVAGMLPAQVLASELETAPQEPAVETTAPAETTLPTLPAEPEQTEPAALETEPAPEETVPAETVLMEPETVYEEISEVVVPSVELPESGQLYDGYLERLFYGGDAAFFGIGARERLTEIEKKFYDYLKEEILLIAAGERTSTRVEIKKDVLAQWGLTVSFDVSEGSTTNEKASIVQNGVFEQVNRRNIINALMYDCPYEMYWYDKTKGTLITSGCSLSGTTGTVTRVMFNFRVVGDMQPSVYDEKNPTIDVSSVTTAKAAAENARQVVGRFASYRDYEKLTAYKDEICGLTSYDYAAASHTNYTTDADPWQLIYVFDGDPDTKVVCEGYAKAFQYLFDLSSFEGSVESRIVVGALNGGGHMWNVVAIDGKNYMVDVTNSDSGTAGQNGGLFLVGGKGSVTGGYTFLGHTFTYTDNTIALWGEENLRLEETDYICPPAIVASGVYGENLTWKLDDAGTLTVSGSGAMEEGSYPWSRYSANVTTLVVEAGVASIASSAFLGFTALTDVTLPGTVKTIGIAAFANCAQLEQITIPEGVETIDFVAFQECCDLTTVSLPVSLTAIHQMAFRECAINDVFYAGDAQQWAAIRIDEYNESLTEAIVHFGDGTIQESTKPTWSLADGVLTISGTGAMEDYATAPWYAQQAGIHTLVVGEGITAIGNSAFKALTELRNVTLPETLTVIGMYAFSGCRSLATISLPAGLERIGVGAFSDCTALTEISIPANVKTISDAAFSECSGLAQVFLPGGLQTIGDFAFQDCPITHVYYNGSDLDWCSVVIGMGNEALTEAEMNYAQVTGSASGRCGENLTWLLADGILTISGTGKMYDYEGQSPWAATARTIRMLTVEEGVTSIGDFAFAACASLTALNLPSTLETIGTCAFSTCAALTEVSIPEGVTAIGDAAFIDCSKLSQLTLPASLASIGLCAFSDPPLTAVYYGSTAADWAKIAIGEENGGLLNASRFYADGSIAGTWGSNVSWLLKDGTLTISGSGDLKAGSIMPWSAYKNTIQTITIEEGITSLPAASFGLYTKMTRLNLPGSLERIGDGAFATCAALEEVVIPEGLKHIGAAVFIDCAKLTTVHLPSTLETVGDFAFRDCTRLKTIVFMGSAPEFGINVCGGVTAIARYRSNDPSWTEAVRLSCGGSLTWEDICLAGHTEVKDSAVAPTCTETGLSAGSHCGICDAVLVAQNELPKLGHKEVTDPGYPATCTENGLREGKHCDRCGEILVEQIVIKALGHKEAILGAVAPTCTATGLTEGKGCSVCDAILVAQTVVAAKGHTEVTDLAVAPDCENTGLTEGSHCAVCGEVLVPQEEVPALGHKEGTPVIENNVTPGCENTGSYETVICCTRCGVELSRETTIVNALGHSYNAVITAPTCTEDGYTTYTCGICDHIDIGDYMDALGHNYESVVTEPSCTVDGWTTYTCTGCGDTYTDTLPAPGHEAVVDEAVAPDCENTGLTEGSHCAVCGEVLVPQEEVPALGHLVHVESSWMIATGHWYCYAYADCEREGCTLCEEFVGDVSRTVLSEATCVDEEIVRWTATFPEEAKQKYNFTDAWLDETGYKNPDAHLPHAARLYSQIPEKGQHEVLYTCCGKRQYEAHAFDAASHGCVCGEVATFRIDWHVNGHPWSFAYVKYGAALYEPDYMIPEGHSFSGWNTPATMPGEDTVLNATLTVNTYTVTLLVDGEQYGEVLSIRYGETVELPTPEKPAGSCNTYTFSGWGDVPETMPAKDLTIEGSFLETFHHSFTTKASSEEVAPANCVDNQVVKVQCDNCEAVSETLTVEVPETAWGHTEGELIRENQVEPGCVKEGSYEEAAYCTVCSAELHRHTTVMEALGHDFHLRICQRCGLVNEADYRIYAGKSMTLKRTNPETNKAYTTKELTWTLAEEFEPFATVTAAGKITARKVPEKVRIEVVGIVAATEEKVSVLIDILPALTQAELLYDGEVASSNETVRMDFAEEAKVLRLNTYPADTLAEIRWSVSDTKNQYADYEMNGDTLVLSNPTGKSGTVTITATVDAGVKKTVTLKIQFGSFAKTVEIAEPDRTTLRGGESLTLTAAVTDPEKVTKPGITWTSSDKNVATVSAAGKVLARSVAHPTDVIITATSKDGLATASVKLTILPREEGKLVLSDGEKMVTGTVLRGNPGDSFRLDALTVIQGLQTGESVVWTSSRDTAAAVSESGVVTCVGVGTAKITATAFDGRTAQVTVKVGILAQSVTIRTKDAGNRMEENGETLAWVASGKSLTLEAEILPAKAAKSVQWQITEGGDYAKIVSGKLTAAKDLTGPKYVTVQAMTRDGSDVSGTIRVKILPLATGVQIFENGNRVRSNTTYTVDMLAAPAIRLSARVYPAAAHQGVELTSSNRKVADFVDGQLVCYKTGTVTITAKALDGSNAKDSFRLTVVKKVTDLALKEGAKLTVVGGRSLKLAPMVQITPGDATNRKLNWKVSPNAYGISISSAGVLSTRKVDEPVTVNIMVTPQDGGSGFLSFDVTISPA